VFSLLLEKNLLGLGAHIVDPVQKVHFIIVQPAKLVLELNIKNLKGLGHQI
jgi:hypothetical protein